MATINPFLIVFMLALSLALVLTPLADHLGHRLGIIDHPRGRRQHPRPVARLGGVALYGSFVVSVLVAQLLPVPRMDPNEVIRMTGLLIGSTFIFIVGLLDDIFVQIGSATLGAGKPLLPRSIVKPPLKLISVRQVGTAFAELHYEVPHPA